jgi:hypothetical protein
MMISLNEKNWSAVEFDGQKRDYIVQKYNLSHVLAGILASK